MRGIKGNCPTAHPLTFHFLKYGGFVYWLGHHPLKVEKSGSEPITVTTQAEGKLEIAYKKTLLSTQKVKQMPTLSVVVKNGFHMAPSSSGPGRWVFIPVIGGSNPPGVTIKKTGSAIFSEKI